MGDDECRAALGKAFRSQSKKTATACQCLYSGTLGQTCLSSADSVDHGAHCGTVVDIVTQHGYATIIAGGLQIGIQETVGQIRPLGVQQVHHSKGDFAHHIDPAQCRIEFDAIEGNGLLAYKRDIAEVQIAMTFANKAACMALLESIHTSGIFSLARLAQSDQASLVLATFQQSL